MNDIKLGGLCAHGQPASGCDQCRAADLIQRHKDAVEVVRIVEWSGSLDGYACCPMCYVFPEQPHNKGCKLDAVLNAEGRFL